ncbi:MAG: RidA family protein [Actinomycetota bacterium]|nr:MAG: RidA family protein [Actinomycetota bacterium]
MGTVAARLAELGLRLPPVAAALSAYVPAVRTGNYVHTAGQLPLVDGDLLATGRVGAGVDPATATACARICALNGLAAVASVVDLDEVVRVVKVVGFVSSAADFTGQSAVIDGASTLLGEVFGTAGQHARSAVGVAVLPRDAPVEVELLVEVAAGA